MMKKPHLAWMRFLLVALCLALPFAATPAGKGDKEDKEERGPKSPEAKVRVTGKSRDDLQAVIAAVQSGDFPVALQFQNFRD